MLATAIAFARQAGPLAQAPAAPARQASGQARPRPSITIPRAAQPPNIDDYLTLGADDGAAPGAVDTARGLRIEGFLQREPGDLVPVSEPTKAYLSYDAVNLYVVFVCRVSSPSRLRARMARRESVFSDDFVAVMLDTFNDRQRSYMFFSNPLGIQADGITTEGQNDDMSFDTVWQSRGRRHAVRLRRLVRDPVQEPALPAG